jgi:beta-galactosidase
VLLRPLTAAEVTAGGQAGGPAGCGPEAALTAARPHVEPGGSVSALLTVTNPCATPVSSVVAAIDAPDGWTATPASVPLGAIGAGKSASAQVTIARPAGGPNGERLIMAGVRAVTSGGSEVLTSAALTVIADPASPHGTAKVSDLEFLSARNGWGPVERNLSNGEQQAGDGRPLAVGGTVYPHGLGVHADSSVQLFLGGNCSRFTASVGLDDEAGDDGSAVFEMWADGVRVWGSPAQTGSGGPLDVDVPVTGATVLELRVTDAGDGNAHDHADWAIATLTC